MNPKFFPTPREFRAWLEDHHLDEAELWVGFCKKGSGRSSISWPEAVDQALCFGWIDGVRKSIDEESYANRFTPRRAGSTWSAVNIKRAQELSELGLMRPAGLKAFEARREERSGVYSYEQRNAAQLGDEFEGLFRANQSARDFFQAQPSWYRKTAIWWVVSAKKDETRRKRLATLIDDSAHARTIRQLTRPPKAPSVE
ncbi:MAG: hypothetical protein QOJ59_557 [Thermomicrobiales bacterium]|jgi:uncharacterized protein YdeI (YjbR/CyaY-like superfamily)|nr:hypothetical protein [Thermomicrobiales bacterium]